MNSSREKPHCKITCCRKSQSTHHSVRTPKDSIVMIPREREGNFWNINSISKEKRNRAMRSSKGLRKSTWILISIPSSSPWKALLCTTPTMPFIIVLLTLRKGSICYVRFMNRIKFVMVFMCSSRRILQRSKNSSNKK